MAKGSGTKVGGHGKGIPHASRNSGYDMRGSGPADHNDPIAAFVRSEMMSKGGTARKTSKKKADHHHAAGAQGTKGPKAKKSQY